MILGGRCEHLLTGGDTKNNQHQRNDFEDGIEERTEAVLKHGISLDKVGAFQFLIRQRQLGGDDAGQMASPLQEERSVMFRGHRRQYHLPIDDVASCGRRNSPAAIPIAELGAPTWFSSPFHEDASL